VRCWGEDQAASCQPALVSTVCTYATRSSPQTRRTLRGLAAQRNVGGWVHARTLDGYAPAAGRQGAKVAVCGGKRVGLYEIEGATRGAVDATVLRPLGHQRRAVAQLVVGGVNLGDVVLHDGPFGARYAPNGTTLCKVDSGSRKQRASKCRVAIRLSSVKLWASLVTVVSVTISTELVNRSKRATLFGGRHVLN